MDELIKALYQNFKVKDIIGNADIDGIVVENDIAINIKTLQPFTADPNKYVKTGEVDDILFDKFTTLCSIHKSIEKQVKEIRYENSLNLLLRAMFK